MSTIFSLIFRDDKLDIVLDARPLKKQMWNQISASLDKIKDQSYSDLPSSGIIMKWNLALIVSYSLKG